MMDSTLGKVCSATAARKEEDGGGGGGGRTSGINWWFPAGNNLRSLRWPCSKDVGGKHTCSKEDPA